MSPFRDLHHDERGMGLVTALAVAFIVFALGAVWVATADHELGEVVFQRHRSQAINAAEAGARRAMAELQNNNPTDGEWFDDAGAVLADGVRDEAKSEGIIWLGHDLDDSACSPGQLTVAGDTLGEYVVRVERLDDAAIGLEYRIESWGWGPSRGSRQTVLRKVSINVILKPLDTFAKALFASKSIVGTNRKEIYGDVYSGESVVVSNFTRIYPNDDPNEAGTGTLEIYGDLFVNGGTNAEFGGPVLVEGGIEDNATGSTYTDVAIGAVTGTGFTVGTESYFKKATVNDLRTAGTLANSSNVNGPVTEGAQVDSIPQIPLPTFETGDLDTSLGKTFYNSGTGSANISSFESYFASNKTTLSGVHIVDLDGESMVVDFKNTKFAGHFVLIAQDGDLTIKGFSKGLASGAPTPTSVGIVMDDTSVPGTYADLDVKEAALGAASLYTMRMETGFASIPGVLHHLIFAEGYYGASQQTTIYGTVYGHDDISSNRMEIHFRSPDEDISSGFEFVIPDSTRFIAQPVLWRELNANEGEPVPAACSS